MDKIVQYLIKSTHCFSHERKSWEAIFSSLIHQGTKPPLQSKDPALFQRDWDSANRTTRRNGRSRKTLPCSKGIETFWFSAFKNSAKSKDPALFQRDWDMLKLVLKWRTTLSKDPALFQRDWDQDMRRISSSHKCRKTLPCSKGIETPLSCYTKDSVFCRKTLPCSKGIETSFWRVRNSRSCRKTLPCSKGIETFQNAG